jgi:hypothetical protein
MEDGKKCGLFLWEDDAFRRERQAQGSISSLMSAKPPNQAAPASAFASKYAYNAPTPTVTSTAPNPSPSIVAPQIPPAPETPSKQPKSIPVETKRPEDDDSDAQYAPDSDDEEAFISAADKLEAEAANAQISTTADGDDAETPRKAPRTINFSTPGAKRKFDETLAPSSGSTIKSSQSPPNVAAKEPKDAVLATPPTTLGKRKFADSGLTSSTKQTQFADDSKALDDALLDLVSPFSTPTPTPSVARNRSAGIVSTTMSASPFTSNNTTAPITVEEIAEILKSEDSSLNVEEGSSLWKKLEQLCVGATRRTRGIVQSRDIVRKALVAKESKIAELQYRVKTLEAELDTEREIIKALREQGME